MPPHGTLLSPTGKPVVPHHQLAALLAGIALVEMGYTGQQAAEMIRRVNAVREARQAERQEQANG